MKTMRQLITLMEGVVAVPGIGASEANMQTAGTVGRDQAVSAFDNAQSGADSDTNDGHEFHEDSDDATDASVAISRFNYLTNSYVDPQVALDIVIKEMTAEGHTGAELNSIAASIIAAFDEANTDLPDDDENFDVMSLASTGHDDDVEFEESYDLQNGYDDINCADGNDFFPNGADGPVVKATGPSGARQGDNPEQKKMQVSEVHKSLVYGYRNYLKESIAKK